MCLSQYLEENQCLKIGTGILGLDRSHAPLWLYQDFPGGSPLVPTHHLQPSGPSRFPQCRCKVITSSASSPLRPRFIRARKPPSARPETSENASRIPTRMKAFRSRLPTLSRRVGTYSSRVI